MNHNINNLTKEKNDILLQKEMETHKLRSESERIYEEINLERNER